MALAARRRASRDPPPERPFRRDKPHRRAVRFLSRALENPGRKKKRELRGDGRRQADQRGRGPAGQPAGYYGGERAHAANNGEARLEYGPLLNRGKR